MRQRKRAARSRPSFPSWSENFCSGDRHGFKVKDLLRRGSKGLFGLALKQRAFRYENALKGLTFKGEA